MLRVFADVHVKEFLVILSHLLEDVVCHSHHELVLVDYQNRLFLVGVQPVALEGTHIGVEIELYVERALENPIEDGVGNLFCDE